MEGLLSTGPTPSSFVEDQGLLGTVGPVSLMDAGCRTGVPKNQDRQLLDETVIKMPKLKYLKSSTQYIQGRLTFSQSFP